MSTFLELCADVARESGAIGTAPSAVTGQTGRQLKCVEWVAQAWRLIQNSRRDWTFLRADWSESTVINQLTYDGTDDFALTRFGEFLGDRPKYSPTTIYLPADGQDTEAPLVEIDFDTWKTRYDRGSHDATKPIEYCIAPDRTLRIGPKPNAVYTIRGEYRKAPQTLAADADEPDLPERFHEIIVWRAIMLMSGSDEAGQAFGDARAKYSEIFANMVRDCVPKMHLEGPLA